MATRTRTITRTEKVQVVTNVETFVLPTGSQSRLVTREAGTGRFISNTPLTKVNHRF